MHYEGHETKNLFSATKVHRKVDQCKLNAHSSLLNNRAAHLINFQKKSSLEALIPSCTFINFEEFSNQHVYSSLHVYLILEIFQEEYISSSWDLLSAIGGAIGLWLGWSVISIGNTLVDYINMFLNRFKFP